LTSIFRTQYLKKIQVNGNHKGREERKEKGEEAHALGHGNGLRAESEGEGDHEGHQKLH